MIPRLFLRFGKEPDRELFIDAIDGDPVRLISAPNLPEAAMVIEARKREHGGRHAAGLHFGDCCAYALSAVSGESLLFKGTDFVQTDVKPAMRPR